LASRTHAAFPGAALTAGLIAAKRGDPGRARPLLHAVLATGGDTAQARAALGALAARERRWTDAVAELHAALAAAVGSFRRPYPREFLVEGLTQLALEGPPDSAAALVDAALDARPGWARLYELRAVAALRVGRCDAAARDLLTLLEFGITRADGPDLLRQCRRGLVG
jgi:hypothetical protein